MGLPQNTLLSGSVLSYGSGTTTVATEQTARTAVTATSSRAMQARGETFASWVKGRASGASAPNPYDKYVVEKYADRAPDAASRLSSLDYYDAEAADGRLWRAAQPAFSKERRFPRLRQFDTRGGSTASARSASCSTSASTTSTGPPAAPAAPPVPEPLGTSPSAAARRASRRARAPTPTGTLAPRRDLRRREPPGDVPVVDVELAL
ncbi:hypothetical protein JL722_11019 [Aureococcus anophagefferens]|nr:hypothetical protein JL722_11019 [Aureococcus anophagefferens]